MLCNFIIFIIFILHILCSFMFFYVLNLDSCVLLFISEFLLFGLMCQFRYHVVILFMCVDIDKCRH